MAGFDVKAGTILVPRPIENCAAATAGGFTTVAKGKRFQPVLLVIDHGVGRDTLAINLAGSDVAGAFQDGSVEVCPPSKKRTVQDYPPLFLLHKTAEGVSLAGTVYKLSVVGTLNGKRALMVGGKPTDLSTCPQFLGHAKWQEGEMAELLRDKTFIQTKASLDEILSLPIHSRYAFALDEIQVPAPVLSGQGMYSI